MKEVALSILGKNKKVDLVNSMIAKGVKYIHYDVMDGKFVDNFSLPIEEVKEIINNTKFHFKDLHLMVENPEDYIKEIESDVDQISIHFEAPLRTTLIKIIKSSSKIGLAINPDTTIDSIEEYIPYLNHVMIMSVYPGKGGQKFIESSLDKIKKLKELKGKLNKDLVIEIDGGINNEWGPIVFDLGVNIAVSGSYLINTIDNGGLKLILGK